jgi:hypothetical protein
VKSWFEQELALPQLGHRSGLSAASCGLLKPKERQKVLLLLRWWAALTTDCAITLSSVLATTPSVCCCVLDLMWSSLAKQLTIEVIAKLRNCACVDQVGWRLSGPLGLIRGPRGRQEMQERQVSVSSKIDTPHTTAKNSDGWSATRLEERKKCVCEHSLRTAPCQPLQFRAWFHPNRV